MPLLVWVTDGTAYCRYSASRAGHIRRDQNSHNRYPFCRCNLPMLPSRSSLWQAAFDRAERASSLWRTSDAAPTARHSLRFAENCKALPWQQALALELFSLQLAMPPDGFGPFAHASLAGFFVSAPPLHFPEDSLALHLLFQDFEGLVDVVVADGDLQLTPAVRGAPFVTEAASPVQAAGRTAAGLKFRPIARRS